MKKISNKKDFLDLLEVLEANMKQKYTKKDLQFLMDKGFHISEVDTGKWFEQKHIGRLKDKVFQFSLKLNKTSWTLLSAQIELDENVFEDIFKDIDRCLSIKQIIFVATLFAADRDKLKDYLIKYSEELDVNKCSKDSLKKWFDYLIIKNNSIYGFDSSSISHLGGSIMKMSMSFDVLIENCLRIYGRTYEVPSDKIDEFTKHVKRRNKIEKLLQGA